MLDQNTDRMWYVIGAVIVGAAIILILNGTAPELFASVADTFKGKTDEVTSQIDEFTKELDVISEGMYGTYSSGEVSEVQVGDNPSFILHQNGRYSGVKVDASSLDLVLGATYEMSYTVQKLDGVLINIGGVRYGESFNDNTMFINGRKVDEPVRTVVPDTTDPYDVRVVFTPSEVTDATSELYRSIYIQPNYAADDQDVTVRISDWTIRRLR